MPKKYYATLENDGYTEEKRSFEDLPLLKLWEPCNSSLSKWGFADYTITVNISHELCYIYEVPENVGLLLEYMEQCGRRRGIEDIQKTAQTFFSSLEIFKDGSFRP